jgi:hypothetical protein
VGGRQQPLGRRLPADAAAEPHDGVLALLGAVQETIELPVFEVPGVFEDDDTVASRVRVRVRFRESGREVDDDEWHIRTFDGKVAC